MSRKIVLLLSGVCLAFFGAITMSCGSSSNSGTGTGSCTGGPYDVVGDWSLNVSGSGGASSSGVGVINTSGLAVFFQTSLSSPAPGDTVVFPAITGTCSFSGAADAYGTPASGGGTASDTVQGNVNSATSITGTISNGNTFSLAPNSPLGGPTVGLGGSGWLGEVEGEAESIIWEFTLSPSGSGNSMDLTGAGRLPSGTLCDVSGTFSQEGGNEANLNIFDVSLSFGAGCPYSSVNGLGFESASDYFALNGHTQGLTYLYAASSNSAFALEIFLPAIN
jgi:hypothetical protein